MRTPAMTTNDPLGDQVRAVLAAAMGQLQAARPPVPPVPPPTPEPAPPPPHPAPEDTTDEVADSWDDEDLPTPETEVATATSHNEPAPEPAPLALPAWYPAHINSATFDLQKFLQSIPNIAELLKIPEGRRALTFADPLLFALVYLPHHLKDANNPSAPPSFADCHFDWCRTALNWVANRNRTDPIEPAEDRIAEVAPRMCGKSTWWFLIIALWAAAHGHKKFIAAFASTSTQAEGHLRTFKNEIDTNRYLREDFPDLCSPKRRPRGAIVADRVDTYQAQSGFVFVAKGIDSNNLGMKVEEARPDFLLLDDVEPDERMYSADLAKKRLGTIQDAILQLNIYASVVFVGTVTMPNSIIHQIVKHSQGNRDPELDWVRDEKIQGHHYLPIVKTVDPATGIATERSLWPEKWSLEYLKSIQHTRSYAKNYANDPKGRDGDYWNDEDFTRVAFTRTTNTRTAIFIDPPTTTSRYSDPAGIAVVSWNPPTPEQLSAPYEMEAPRPTRESGTLKKRARNTTIKTHPGTVSVRHAESQKLTGRPLAQYVYSFIASRPDLNIQRIIVEVTQGGDLWLEVFAGSPVRVEVVNPRESKEVRFERALNYYQKTPTLVTHDAGGNTARMEEEQLSFPKGAHDDIADAGITGILYFLEPRPRKRRAQTKVRSYV